MAPAESDRERALLALLFHGLRISEAVGLDVPQMRDGALVGIRGKGGRIRTVPLSPQGRSLLVEYIGTRESGPLLLSRSKRRLSVRAAQDVVYAVTERAGHRANAHRFRHTAATLMLRSGAGLEHVQDFLGHASPTTTRVYARLTAADLIAAVDGANLLGEEGTEAVRSLTGSEPPVPSESYRPAGLKVIEGGRRG